MASSRQSTNQFYRNYFEIFIYILVVAIFILLIGSGWVLYQVSHRPLPIFYAAKPGSQPFQLRSFDHPNVTPDRIIKWASKAAVAAYNFNFADYETKTEVARPYFTADGWTAYKNAIAKVVKRVKQAQLIVQGVVRAPPVIHNFGLLNENPSWRVEIPFIVTYLSANESENRDYFIILTIVSVPTSVNPDGIAIDAFRMR